MSGVSRLSSSPAIVMPLDTASPGKRGEPVVVWFHLILTDNGLIDCTASQPPISPSPSLSPPPPRQTTQTNL